MALIPPSPACTVMMDANNLLLLVGAEFLHTACLQTLRLLRLLLLLAQVVPVLLPPLLVLLKFYLVPEPL